MPTSTLLSARAAYAAIDSMFQGDEYRKAIERTAMSQFLVSNIICDTAVTNRLRGEALQRAMAPRGVIQQGERIIDKGDVVTPELYSLLRTYEKIAGQKSASQVDSTTIPYSVRYCT